MQCHTVIKTITNRDSQLHMCYDLAASSGVAGAVSSFLFGLLSSGLIAGKNKTSWGL